MRHVVVMGVCGCGKSSVAAELSRLTGLPWADADDLHPAANVARMRAGTPLTDADRAPWLDRCAEALAGEGGLILACSALRRAYRDRLRAGAGPLLFVHLTGAPDLLHARMAARRNHYMPPALLASQLATLEPPAADEGALTLTIDRPVAELAAAIRPALAPDPHPQET